MVNTRWERSRILMHYPRMNKPNGIMAFSLAMVRLWSRVNRIFDATPRASFAAWSEKQTVFHEGMKRGVKRGWTRTCSVNVYIIDNRDLSDSNAFVFEISSGNNCFFVESSDRFAIWVKFLIEFYGRFWGMI